MHSQQQYTVTRIVITLTKKKDKHTCRFTLCFEDNLIHGCWSQYFIE